MTLQIECSGAPGQHYCTKDSLAGVVGLYIGNALGRETLSVFTCSVYTCCGCQLMAFGTC